MSFPRAAAACAACQGEHEAGSICAATVASGVSIVARCASASVPSHMSGRSEAFAWFTRRSRPLSGEPVACGACFGRPKPSERLERDRGASEPHRTFDVPFAARWVDEERDLSPSAHERLEEPSRGAERVLVVDASRRDLLHVEHPDETLAGRRRLRLAPEQLQRRAGVVALLARHRRQEHGRLRTVAMRDALYAGLESVGCLVCTDGRRVTDVRDVGLERPALS